MDQDKRKLHMELSGLRSNLNIILDTYTINVNSKINEMLEILEGKDFIGEKRSLPSKKRVQYMIDVLRGLKIKPEKGRGKDLVRIQKALTEILDLFEE